MGCGRRGLGEVGWCCRCAVAGDFHGEGVAVIDRCPVEVLGLHGVAATVRRVSGKHRREIERELRAAIADDIDARVALGETPGQAEYAALSDLGDPARLATRYADRATVLVGPETYPSYVRALRALCATVLPIVYIGHDIG